MQEPYHSWTTDDDLLAYCEFRFEETGSKSSQADLAYGLSIKATSMDMKIRNYRSLRGIGKLIEITDQAEAIFNYYEMQEDPIVLDASIEALKRKWLNASAFWRYVGKGRLIDVHNRRRNWVASADWSQLSY
jgi:hypothetical protein